MPTRFRIIRGSDAGISAALRAREINRDAEVTVLLEELLRCFMA